MTGSFQPARRPHEAAQIPVAVLEQDFDNLGANEAARLYQDSGVKELIQRFHESITRGTPPPIPYREILLTARIMDSSFAQIRAAQASTANGSANGAPNDTANEARGTRDGA